MGTILSLLFDVVEPEFSLAKVVRSDIYKGINVDYYIPSINTVVEVQGIQHYSPSSFGRDNVESVVNYTRQLNRDDRLRIACKSRGVKVIEIPYDYSYNQILSELTECKDVYNGD